jgi:hypothetical protein
VRACSARASSSSAPSRVVERRAMRRGDALVLAKPRNPVPRASPNPIGVARRVSGIWVHAPFLYERRGTIIPLITLMKGASGTPAPPCVSEYPNVRMSEYPNVRIIHPYAQAVRNAKTDPARHPSTPHSSTAIRDAGRRRGRRRRRRTRTDAKTRTPV